MAEQPPLKLDTSSEVSGVSFLLCQAVGWAFGAYTGTCLLAFPLSHLTPHLLGSPCAPPVPTNRRCLGMLSGSSSEARQRRTRHMGSEDTRKGPGTVESRHCWWFQTHLFSFPI